MILRDLADALAVLGAALVFYGGIILIILVLEHIRRMRQ